MENKKSLNYVISVNTDDVKDKMKEIKKIIDRINYHSKELDKAINDLNSYRSNCEIKYSLEAASNKSCQVSNDE